MKQLLHTIGLDDGTGNTSSTRVFMFMFALTYVASKFFNAIQFHQPIVFDGSDAEIIGVIGGIGIGKNMVENQPVKTP